MADTVTPTTPPAAVPQDQPSAVPAPAADDPAALKAERDALQKHKLALEADLKKLRDARKVDEDRVAAEKADAEKKLREAGDFAKLHDAEKEKRLALEAQVAALTPVAERFTAYEKRVKETLDAAKAKGDLPAHITMAIDGLVQAGNIDAALVVLDGHTKAPVTPGATPPKQPAAPAPNPGGAPPTLPPGKKPSEMTDKELDNLRATNPDAYYAHIGGSAPGKTNSSVLDWFSRRAG